MSSSSLPPLQLEFVRVAARDALCALILTITIAVPTLAAAGYGLVVMTLAAIVSSVCAGYVHRRAGWLGSTYRVSAAVWDSEGQWWLTLAGQSRIAAELCPESIVTRFGAWLIFRTERGRKCFLLVVGAMFPRVYRSLLVRLRIRGIAAAHSPGAPDASDAAHVRAHFPLWFANFRQARGSTRALRELPWPRATRGEARRP